MNSHQDECPTHTYALKMDSAGLQDLDATLASIFSIDGSTGVMTYSPSITGNFTFYIHAQTESGVKASREIQIASEFYMDILFVYPDCFIHYGHCLTQSQELFANKAYEFDN